MPEWAFITRHAVALSLIARYPRITALELGKEMGITERAVRKIIANLAAKGYISKKERVGGCGTKLTRLYLCARVCIGKLPSATY